MQNAPASLNPAAVNEEHAPVNWVTAILFTLLPLAALIFVPWYGIAHGFSTASVVLFFVFLWAGGVSITAGYHRLWSHRAYSAHWSVRLFFMLFGAMSLQNSILIWASQHRTHHRFVDDVERDPYSARRGFWFSHMGWILRNYKSGENDFSKRLLHGSHANEPLGLGCRLLRRFGNESLRSAVYAVVEVREPRLTDQDHFVPTIAEGCPNELVGLAMACQAPYPTGLVRRIERREIGVIVGDRLVHCRQEA